MPKLESIKDLFDEQSEVMAWVVLVLGVALLAAGYISDVVFLGMVSTSLVTMLGAARFKGLKIGSDIGVE